jgi:membrane protein YqaA with SNARE-associated domain
MDFELWTLAVSAFTSATILPGTSDIALTALMINRPQDWAIILFIASVANSLGAILSYLLGRWLPKRQKISDKALVFLRRYGVWTLLFSWVPVVGDLLPIAAGWLRLNMCWSMLMITIGKTLRYAGLTWLILQF